MQHKARRLGLSGKLILAMLGVGMIPLAIGLSGTYYIGRGELQEVIGASFQVLAEDSAAKVDAEIQRILTVDRILAHQAKDGFVIQTLGHPFHHQDSSIVPFDWPHHGEDTETHASLQRSWITGPEAGGPEGKTADTAMAHKAMVWLETNSATQNYQLHISTPMLDLDEGETVPAGWFHRTYDINKLLTPLTHPIRFGDTGHVMIIDDHGSIISCPLLETGSHIEDQSHTFIDRLTKHQPGWITAENDGHGAFVFSIIGHAPLAGMNTLLQKGESWHMFVWQDSQEIFAPIGNLLFGVALAGLLAIILLIGMGYYASRRIVQPIRKLRDGASNIAAGDLSKPLSIHTGDEIEDLAGEFDEMRIQLRQYISTLEEKLTGSEQHFRAVTESANDAIISGAESGGIVGWNAAAEKLFGYTEAEIQGQPLTLLMPERFRHLHGEGLSRVAAGGVPHVIGKTVELAGLRKDGNEFPLELSLAQWQASDGQFFTGIIRDITERKQRDKALIKSQDEKEQVLERLIQSEKVAAIGTMASGIGHEINNPLYVISSMAEAIRDEKDIAECNEYGQDILKYAKEIAVIVKNLSGYTRPASRKELDKIDVHEKLTDAITMARISRLDDLIEIRQDFAPVPKITATHEEIKQVFFNIIRNGMQAMSGEGILDVNTSLEKNQVCIRITDMGHGITKENIGKIFDPFFTTKGPDEGEGLGMYIVQKIVNKYDGAIGVESEEGKGTTFTITFPACEPDQPEDTDKQQHSGNS
ncbi:MAG: PAS domain S-box protein [Mariprofundus sp.]|nr:PAS domain S-box protein [Mariprofundus sp.]